MIHKQQRRPIKKYKGKAKTLWIDASALFNASYSQTGTQPVSGCTAASFLHPPSKIPFVFQEIKVILHFLLALMLGKVQRNYTGNSKANMDKIKQKIYTLHCA